MPVPQTSNLKPQTSVAPPANMTAGQASDLRMLLTTLGWASPTIQDWLEAGWQVRTLSQVPTDQVDGVIHRLCLALAAAVHADAGITEAALADALFALPNVLNPAAPCTAHQRRLIGERKALITFKHPLHWENFCKKHSDSPDGRLGSCTIAGAAALLAELDRRIAAAQAAGHEHAALDGAESDGL